MINKLHLAMIELYRGDSMFPVTTGTSSSVSSSVRRSTNLGLPTLRN